MIRRPQPGQAVTIPGWPQRQPATIVRYQRARSCTAAYIVCELPDGTRRNIAPIDVDPAEIPARNRRRSAGYARAR
jgi:hypothetical protein